jgi:cyclopropane fatty-acyl-phospholipid synthase-like methyltransferase
MPYVNPAHTAVEIGPGGGRWTRYLLGFGRLYLVDFHAEILAEAKRTFRRYSHVYYIVNHGHDFPGIPPSSVDFLFSFGTFVHLELPIIAAYLAAMKTILKPDANVVLQYSDKRKVMAQLNPGFANTTPDEVRREVENAGFEVLEEDLTTLWHSSVIRFRPAAR